MKLLRTILVVTLMVASQPSVAYLAKGGGGNSCAYLLDNFSQAHRKLWQQWITGFITGINFSEDGQVGKDIDESALVYEVKNYCEKNPTELVTNAAANLYYKLKK